MAAFAEREEVAALELNVSCPNVETGLIIGADAERDRRAARRGPPADDQAADREADAQLHLAGGGRRGRGGARRRRRLADQHAARHGLAPAPPGRAVARRRHRRRVRAGRPRDRPGPGRATCARGSAIPIVGHGRGPARPPCRAICCTPAQISSPSAPSRSATRSPGARRGRGASGADRSAAIEAARGLGRKGRAIKRPRRTSSSTSRTPRSQNACKPREHMSSSLQTVRPQLEVQPNWARFGLPTRAFAM